MVRRRRANRRKTDYTRRASVLPVLRECCSGIRFRRCVPRDVRFPETRLTLLFATFLMTRNQFRERRLAIFLSLFRDKRHGQNDKSHRLSLLNYFASYALAVGACYNFFSFLFFFSNNVITFMHSARSVS